MADAFKNITQGLSDLGSFLGNILDYLNPFSDNFFLKDFFTFLSNALGYINPFNENFIFKQFFIDCGNFFINLLDWLNPFSDNFFVYKLIDLLGELLKFLFVPSEDSINSLVNSVKSKFEFIDTIKNTSTMLEEMFKDTSSLPKITLNLKNNKWYTGEITVMDLSWYSPYKQYGDLIISAFIYVFFFWRIFTSLPGIISGSSGGVKDIAEFSNSIEKISRK